jgi:rod shape determining protein RodA
MRSISKPASGAFKLSEQGPSLGIFTGLDWWLVLSVLLLTALGLATVHSASAELPVDYLPRQAMWVGLGALALLVVMVLDYHLLVDFAVPLYVLALGALMLVLFFGEGPGGTRSWLEIGGFRIGQPAELAKLAAILVLTRYLSDADRRFLGLRQITVCGLVVGLPMALIVLQPDLGSAAMFLPLLAGILLIAGVRLRLLVAVAVLLLVLGGLAWNFGMQEYQRERVRTFLAPESDPLGAGYQVRQSKIAVGSGGIAGRGYKQGTQSQLRFLPARHTDFIFAVLAEEWGFLGVASVLGLYALFISSALRIATRARDRVGIFLVVGFISIFAFHVLYNTAMVVGLTPITGIPLPFLSYGGSFMLLNFVGTGLVLNVDVRRYVNR